MDRTLYVLTGPTAVGKTALALDWAEAHQAEIVSCDAFQGYRGMDIGTAKPTPAERARVPHFLVDHLALDEPWDVARFVAAAREVIHDIQSRDRRVLVTGGSGFYLKAFFGPVTDDVTVPSTIREEVRALEKREGLPGLLDALHALNPSGIRGLDTQNPRRVARALERCRASGRTLAALREAFAARPGPFAGFSVQAVILERPVDALNERIAARVDQMLAAGLVDEVSRLAGEGLRENPVAARAIGYREVLACLDGDLAWDDLRDTLVAHTRQYARRQRTWFRNQLPDIPRKRACAVAAAAGLFG
ncbi:MAG: tRNA (adenosine(37)-N6)-dimethylallyltransferase MiaA [Opitutales bacterium]